MSTPTSWRTDYDQALANWLRYLADAIEKQRVQVKSFGKPVVTHPKGMPDELQFQPDIRFLRDDPEVAKIFSSFPPGVDA